MEVLSNSVDASGLRIAIVVSQYNSSITENLMQGAVETLTENNIPNDQITIARVPGAWEIPLATKSLVDSQRFDAIICLGAVIRGETTHDQHINRFVSTAIGQISLDSRLPIAFGVLTCETFQQANERAGGKVGNKGNEAAKAILEMLGLIKSIGNIN